MKAICLLVSLLFLSVAPRLAHLAEEDADCVLGEDGCPESEDIVTETEGVVDSIAIFTDSDIQEAIRQEDMLVVVFYAPWCHHCHEVLALFKEVASSLEYDGISFGKLDIEGNKETKSRYQITEVPDVRIFRRGIMFHYQGPGEHEGPKAITDYFRKEKGRQDVDNAVLELTEDNFDNIVDSSPLILVEFYAEWCAPCQQLEPHYAAAARRLRALDPPIPLGRVGVPDQLEVAKRFGVGGYPLLIVFRYGKRYNYTGAREEEGIVNYMKRQVGPSSTLLKSAEDVKKFIKSPNEPRVVAYFSESTNSKLVDAFVESGNLLRMDMKLAHCTNADVATEMGQKVETVVVYHGTNLVSKYEKGYSVVTKLPKDAEELENLFLSNARPLVGEFTKTNQLRVYTHRPILVVYLDVNWKAGENKDTLYWHNLVATIAKEFEDNKKDLIFAIANENDFEADIKILGLAETSEDIAVGIWAPGGVRYPMKDEDIDAESLRKFVQAFAKGKLKARINSEPKPKWSKKALIHKVVGTSFENVVLNPAKNVMVKLCIPDTPDCKTAEGYYEKTAARFEGSDEVLFTEMNLALNDLPAGITTDGELPAFLFSRRDSKDTIQVSPKPQDEADLVFFLKFRHQIRPTKTEQEVDQRAKKRKNKMKENKKDGKGKSKDKEKKNEKGKKTKAKDEL